jgi:hypothetical protein
VQDVIASDIMEHLEFPVPGFDILILAIQLRRCLAASNAGSPPWRHDG